MKKDMAENKVKKDEKKSESGEPAVLRGQPCPVCGKNSLQLMEKEMDVPYFGQMFIFNMSCDSEECKYYKTDIEAIEKKDPCRWTIEISTEEDMKIRVVKSSEATVKIPHVTTITPGPASNGYITNVEGILNRVKHEIETARDAEEDEEVKKRAKNLLKKLLKVTWGQEKLKIIIEDPSGNSAIISEKAVLEKMKA
jgi:zinc finger protein